MKYNDRQTELFPVAETEEEMDFRFELPNLSDTNLISLDTETTGLRIWGEDEPVGMSICTPDLYTWYIPWGHKYGDNLDFENVRNWANAELRGKEIVGHKTHFDIEMLRKVGIDLEELGCKVHDTMFPPALISNNRQSYELDTLSRQYLNKRKVVLEGTTPIHERSSNAVAIYAESDASLTMELHQAYKPKISALGLQRVLDLEDELIFCVLAMERNGALIDRPLLEQWHKQVTNRYVNTVLTLYSKVGFRVEPTKPSDLIKLFNYLKLDYALTEEGNPSFTAENLKIYQSIEEVRLAILGRKLASAKSKFFDPYLNKLDKNNILRYSLHQLKADSDSGTVTGRFSASGGGKYINGINPQQVKKADDDSDALADFPIRRLFISSSGDFISADASQIEFRFFAHYSEDPVLVQEYNTNPKADFHKVVMAMTGLERRPAKRIGFGTMYGMGLDKLAKSMEMLPEEAKPLREQFKKKFPAMDRMIKKAAGVAKERGYVRTILGRRAELSDKFYAALNRVIQGTAADYNKLCLLDMYRNRKTLGFNPRFTVHDEICGDAHNGRKTAYLLASLLNEQKLDNIKVPITWNVGIGPNWHDQEDI